MASDSTERPGRAQASGEPDPRSVPIDRSRYRRVRSFFVGVLVHALWWDVILNRPFLRRFRRPALPRWCAIASRYRELALEMGGVLIKLGQFLSARVDILPLEVTRELAGLQDEVPPAPIAAVVAQVEASLERPLDELFSFFDREAAGAASLAQAHAARLVSGEHVVVKVLRPGIEVLVETDLAAFAHALRWLKLSRVISRRVDLGWVEQEFNAVTRRELDLVTEGHSTERFASDFADEPDVVVPAVFWSHTATRTLTLENVAAIKVSDLDSLAEAGIDRSEVARRVYAVYMEQFFVTHFVHADPHPGNIFIRPLPPAEGPALDEGVSSEEQDTPTGRPFQIAFVDFGMMTEIPERLREALRELAIGLGTRDARRIVQSYVTAGSLLPGADIERMVEAHEALLQRFWGVRISEFRDVAFNEAQSLVVEFRDLLFQAPVQLQADMLFAMRAVGLLAGLATTLDPGFDPWAETIPFAERFAHEQRLSGWREWLDELGGAVQRMLTVPTQLDRLVARVERGDLGVQTSLSNEASRRLEHIELSLDRLAWNVAGGALLVAGIFVRVASPGDSLAPWLLGGAAVAALIGLLRRR